MKMGRRLQLSCLVVMSLLVAGVALAAGEVYRWVDESGVVHFGSQPPPGIEATRVNVPKPPPAPPAPATTEAAGPGTAEEPEEEELSYAQARRKERADRRAERTEERAELDRQCAAARQRVEWVEPGPRVLVTGDDGEPRRLTDGERDEILNDAKAFLADNCD